MVSEERTNSLKPFLVCGFMSGSMLQRLDTRSRGRQWTSCVSVGRNEEEATVACMGQLWRIHEVVQDFSASLKVDTEVTEQPCGTLLGRV